MQKSPKPAEPKYSGEVYFNTPPISESGSASLNGSGLFDSYFATVVATFATNSVVDMPCSAMGAECESGGNGLVVCATLRSAGL